MVERTWPAPAAVHLPTADGPRRQLTAWLLVGLVGLAFADTSVVALALPRIYGEFGTDVVTVSWVLTGYAAAVAAVGWGTAAAARRVRPAALLAAGPVLLAVACAACGLAPGLPVLLAARCVQGAAAAVVLAAAVPALGAVLGDRAGRAAWTRAAALGLAAGPALGGVLTQVADWRSIFLAQVPAVLAGPAVLADVRVRTAPATAGRHAGRAGSSGPGLLSAGLVGALFLSVLLVTEVWRLSPLAGAGVVGALPAGMLLAQPLARRADPASAALPGAVALAGGLAAMALLPAATVPWAVAALLVCGAGWALLDRAFDAGPVTGPVTGPVAGTAPAGDGLRSGGLATAARHAGLVVGLVLIAPVLSAGLEHGGERAVLAGTAAVLDARLPLPAKVTVAGALQRGLADGERGRVPDVVGLVEGAGGSTQATRRLGADLEARLREILTRAFRPAFGIAAALGAATLLPGLAALRRRRRGPGAAGPSGRVVAGQVVAGRVVAGRVVAGRVVAGRVVAGSVVALVGVLLAVQVAAGAAGFGAAAPADPCRAAPDPYPYGGLDGVEQSLILATLDGAACSLGVSREALLLSLDRRSGVHAPGVTRERAEPALRAGLDRALDAAQRRGDLPAAAATVIRRLAAASPMALLTSRLDLPSSGGERD